MLKRFVILPALLALAGLASASVSASASAFGQPFLGQFHTVTEIGSTVPSNGDVNPYGIVTVPSSVGSLVRGDILISNFNNSENLQGTGTTIVQESPTGQLSLFAHIAPGSVPFGVGLTTALAILPGGDVVVGSLPTTNGNAKTATAGGLIVLDSTGHVIKTIAGAPINGPWDLTAVSAGPFTDLFVTNVLNGTVAKGEEVTDEGTVVRLGLLTLPGHAPIVTSERVIADGFPEHTSEAALVVGPTGDGLGPEGTLYVADTAGNRIAAVPNALFRQTPLGTDGGLTVTRGGSLNGPLGLTIAPNGDILTANANDGNLVETTPSGHQFEPFETEAGEGGLFGLTLAPNGHGVYFVNDANNSLDLLH